MCLQTSLIKSWNGWNWSGDEILYRPIVPASRPIAGAKTKKRYNIDVRKYLATTDNAVVVERLGDIIQQLPPAEQSLFPGQSATAFRCS